MNSSPSNLSLTKSQRRGVIWTLAIFLVLHLGMLFVPMAPHKAPSTLLLDSISQRKADSLMAINYVESKDTIFPFNPNYISDFKAYQLDISIQAVNRIRSFRATGNYINSLQVFRQVSKLSDSEIRRIRPYLKLPKSQFPAANYSKEKVVKKELNTATTTDLQLVSGIGKVYAQRILELRNKLGGFLVKDQLADVWGLTPEIQQRIWVHFKLDSIPFIQKKNINELTLSQLSGLHYVNNALASKIVAVRTQKENLNSWEDLSVIHQLDSVKKARLSLYLSFN